METVPLIFGFVLFADRLDYALANEETSLVFTGGVENECTCRCIIRGASDLGGGCVGFWARDLSRVPFWLLGFLACMVTISFVALGLGTYG